MKFASFETIVEALYGYMPGQKSDYGKSTQTAVSFAGGYLAGILCAIVSHPADVMVSKLNANRQQGESFGAATGRIYREIGFGGLWNGLPVRIVMIGTLTGLQWMMYAFYHWNGDFGSLTSLADMILSSWQWASPRLAAIERNGSAKR